MDCSFITNTGVKCHQQLFSALPLVFFAWLDMLLSAVPVLHVHRPRRFYLRYADTPDLVGIAWQHFRRPNSDVWLRFAKAMVYALGLLGPLVPLAVLYLASWRAFGVLGHWPRYMMDDPKLICQQDAVYKALCSGVSYAIAFGGWSMISVGALMLHLRRQISPTHLVWMAVCFSSPGPCLLGNREGVISGGWTSGL
jgi:hypothetical protein